MAYVARVAFRLLTLPMSECYTWGVPQPQVNCPRGAAPPQMSRFGLNLPRRPKRPLCPRSPDLPQMRRSGDWGTLSHGDGNDPSCGVCPEGRISDRVSAPPGRRRTHQLHPSPRKADNKSALLIGRQPVPSTQAAVYRPERLKSDTSERSAPKRSSSYTVEPMPQTGTS